MKRCSASQSPQSPGSSPNVSERIDCGKVDKDGDKLAYLYITNFSVKWGSHHRKQFRNASKVGHIALLKIDLNEMKTDTTQ